MQQGDVGVSESGSARGTTPELSGSLRATLHSPGGLKRLVQLSNTLSDVAFAIFDEQFRFVHVNERLAALNEIPISAHLGRSICRVVPGIGPFLSSCVNHALQTKIPLRGVAFSASVPFPHGPIRSWLGSFFPFALLPAVFGVAHTVIEVTGSSRLETILADITVPSAEALHSDCLTAREASVLALIGQGKGTKEIAALLSISALTVANHRKHICRKLHLHSTAELAAFAASRGIEPLPPDAVRCLGTRPAWCTVADCPVAVGLADQCQAPDRSMELLLATPYNAGLLTL